MFLSFLCWISLAERLLAAVSAYCGALKSNKASQVQASGMHSLSKINV
jgi:hypothetical protein